MQRDAHLTNATLMARRRAALPAGLGQAHEIFVVRAENAEVWDVEGRATSTSPAASRCSTPGTVTPR
jgi:4-aminobutyrate aminotransferase-like enzyme